MAFTTVQKGQTIEAEHIKELQGAINGTSGYGQAAAFTQTNSSSSYALDVRNLDSSNGYVARFKDESDNVILTLTRVLATFGKKVILTLGSFAAAADMLSMTATWSAGSDTFNAIKAVVTNTASAAASCIINLQTATATVFAVTIGGKAFINDDSNANMTQGLTIKQGASDDEALALKSSDVAHGMTDWAETDTYGKALKSAGDNGGLRLIGLDDGASSAALWLEGFQGAAADTTHTGSGFGVIRLTAAVKTGTTVEAVGAEGNLFSIDNYGGTKFLVDGEGDTFQDGTAGTAYDSHEDSILAYDLSQVLVGKPERAQRYNRDAFKAMGIIHEGQDGTPMISSKKSRMVLLGAVGQLYEYNKALERMVTTLSQRVNVLEKRG